MTRDGMGMFVSGELDHISLTHTPRGQGVIDGEKIVALCERILFSYVDSLAIRIQSKHDT
jgi:hypothetical protein